MGAEKTSGQYDEVIEHCQAIFNKKMVDYGSSWRIFRPSSLTDQIFIKAQRIRTIQETGANKVGDNIESEFMSIVNYAAMALIQLELGAGEDNDLSADDAARLYSKHVASTKKLMMDKNHDYGEAWRDMRISSLTDLILVKLLRIKQIENNDGATLISEGVDANYQDILNYAVFALIRFAEGTAA
ncbi:MAG: DUF1599 domain-containing protein [Flavobacteriales bacterium]|nr:DUF1599 domain-containing protein [Flavobacteriales bacterium]